MSFIDYATVNITDSDKLSVIHEQLNKPRRFRIKYWNKTNQEWDIRIGYFDDKSQVRLNKAGDSIVITYVEVWEDDGGLSGLPDPPPAGRGGPGDLRRGGSGV